MEIEGNEGIKLEIDRLTNANVKKNKERPMNIMCKMNISKSTYYDMKEKLIFKASEIIYPKFIRYMYEIHLF